MYTLIYINLISCCNSDKSEVCAISVGGIVENTHWIVVGVWFKWWKWMEVTCIRDQNHTVQSFSIHSLQFSMGAPPNTKYSHPLFSSLSLLGKTQQTSLATSNARLLEKSTLIVWSLVRVMYWQFLLRHPPSAMSTCMLTWTNSHCLVSHPEIMHFTPTTHRSIQGRCHWKISSSHQATSLPNKHNLELMISLLFRGASAFGWRRHEVQVVPTLRATSIWMNYIYSISLFQQPSLTWILGPNCRRGCPSSCVSPRSPCEKCPPQEKSTFNPGTARVSGPTPKSFASHWRLRCWPKLWTLKGLP